MLFADDIVLCSPRREHVERQLEECRRAMEERGLKISRKKTEYLGCNEHQDADIHVQGEAVKRVKTFTYLGSTLSEDGVESTLSEDGELGAEVTHRVQCVWENWKRVSGELCDRIMNGEGVQNSGKISTDVRGRDMVVEESTRKPIEGRRNENATMDVRSYDVAQDKKWKNKRDNESGGNHKESPGNEVEEVWAFGEKRGTLRRKEGDGNEGTDEMEERNT